jgi:hypothetical protein
VKKGVFLLMVSISMWGRLKETIRNIGEVDDVLRMFDHAIAPS